MNEASVRLEVHRMLRYVYGLWPDHWPDIKGVKQPGRPDLVVMNPLGPGYYVEVKVLNPRQSKSFKFDAIEDSQRCWLSTWEQVRCNGSYLAIGTVNIGNRGIWLIPWAEWLQIEERVNEYAHYLPYKAERGTLISLQENRFDFRLISHYQLLHHDTYKWRMPHHLEESWGLHPLQKAS